MLVYSDRRSDLFASEILSELARRSRLPSCSELAEQRIMLILAGQLEQAALDGNAPWAPHAHELTSSLAATFVSIALDRRDLRGGSRAQLGEALNTIERMLTEDSSDYAVNIPEGFAWYAVYPEAYLTAALAWSSKHSPSEQVLVIGLRSIGTCLAAVVAEGLRTRGFDPKSFTVRPTGHPYARTVDLPRELAAPDAAIVVDEGPGLSGSSMAAVAAALSRRGVAETAISFFPAHLNGPGRMASSEVRHWWTAVEVLAPGLETTPIGGTTLATHLIAMSPDPIAASRIVDVGGGKWINRASIPAHLINTLAPQLEAPKYLVERRGAATLWKFGGFTLVPERHNGTILTSCEAAEARLDRLSGLVPKPLGSVHGWLGSEWIFGRRLCREDATADRVARMVAYMRRGADAPLATQSEAAARKRLADILLHNSRELVGEVGLSRVRYVCDELLDDRDIVETPTYGDGRMAPHEWIETARGTLIKTDAGGHAFDHTVVGPQSLLWDAAGMMVEWLLPRRAGPEILASLGLPTTLNNVLSYYRAAYAAFRAGVAWLCGAEINRASAITYYREYLRSELAQIQDSRK